MRRARARLHRLKAKRADREGSELGDALRLVAGIAAALVAGLAVVAVVLYLLLR